MYVVDLDFKKMGLLFLEIIKNNRPFLHSDGGDTLRTMKIRNQRKSSMDTSKGRRKQMLFSFPKEKKRPK